MAIPDMPLNLLCSGTHQATMASLPQWSWLGAPVVWTDNERLGNVGVGCHRRWHEVSRACECVAQTMCFETAAMVKLEDCKKKHMDYSTWGLFKLTILVLMGLFLLLITLWDFSTTCIFNNMMDVFDTKILDLTFCTLVKIAGLIHNRTILFELLSDVWALVLSSRYRQSEHNITGISMQNLPLNMDIFANEANKIEVIQGTWPNFVERLPFACQWDGHISNFTQTFLPARIQTHAQTSQPCFIGLLLPRYSRCRRAIGPFPTQWRTCVNGTGKQVVTLHFSTLSFT